MCKDSMDRNLFLKEMYARFVIGGQAISGTISFMSGNMAWDENRGHRPPKIKTDTFKSGFIVHKVKTKRDLTIDLFKGFTILWIIHIHTVFWSGDFYFSDPVRQFTLLIDVPIFFFLSGYLMFVGPSGTLSRSI